MNETVHTIIYLSSISEDFSPEEMNTIITKSRENNHRAGISGILLYASGNIIQVLEGNKDSVTDTFNRITADHRHHGIIKMFDKPVTERSFGNWSMAFNSVISEEYKAIEDISAEDRLLLRGEYHGDNMVIKLLRTFVKNNT